MTCIVGISTEDGVFIGGDSFGSNGHSGTEFPRPKVFKNGEFLIGYTTSYRMGQVLEATFVPPERRVSEKDDFLYLVSSVVPAIRKCFQEAGFESTTKGRFEGGCFLLGYRKKLYEVQSEYSLLETTEASTGSGETFAMGSLFTTSSRGVGGDLELSPGERIHEAITAASYCCVSVGGKINILSITENDS